MSVTDRVKNTPRSDWPVGKNELSGAGKFFGLYGGEHIAATEFVIGATLVQYGCSASDILIGLAIGNLLATLCFALLCAPLATDTRLSLYSYLQRVVGSKVQKLYNLVFGIGFAWTCNVALHLGLNDMSVLRCAKSPKYGCISCVGMFVGHYFAWIGAGILGATASASPAYRALTPC